MKRNCSFISSFLNRNLQRNRKLNQADWLESHQFVSNAFIPTRGAGVGQGECGPLHLELLLHRGNGWCLFPNTAWLACLVVFRVLMLSMLFYYYYYYYCYYFFPICSKYFFCKLPKGGKLECIDCDAKVWAVCVIAFPNASESFLSPCTLLLWLGGCDSVSVSRQEVSKEGEIKTMLYII